jgi:hypothetical protein
LEVVDLLLKAGTEWQQRSDQRKSQIEERKAAQEEQHRINEATNNPKKNKKFM